MSIDPGKDLRMLVLSHLHHDHADGLRLSLGTLDRIAAFARSEPTVLLSAHDPLAERSWRAAC
jgi:metal-dependent hydrolase (beta-lactamase superfamily II)